jgi:hypothetical protein
MAPFSSTLSRVAAPGAEYQVLMAKDANLSALCIASYLKVEFFSFEGASLAAS